MKKKFLSLPSLEQSDKNFENMKFLAIPFVALKGHGSWVHPKRIPHLSRMKALQSGSIVPDIVFEKLKGRVRGALQLKNGNILSWSDDTTLKVWDIKTGKELQTLKGHEFMILRALELKDSTVLSWSPVGALKVWDLSTGRELKNLNTPIWGGYLDAMEIETREIILWGDETIKVWNIETDKVVHVFQNDTDILKCFPAEKDFIVSYDKQQRIKKWNIKSGKEAQLKKEDQRKYKKLATKPLILHDGSQIRVDKNTLSITKKGKEMLLKGHENDITQGFQLKDKSFLSIDKDGIIKIWDIESGKSTLTLHGEKPIAETYCDALELQNGNILSWANHSLRIWSMQNAQKLSNDFEKKLEKLPPKNLKFVKQLYLNYKKHYLGDAFDVSINKNIYKKFVALPSEIKKVLFKSGLVKNHMPSLIGFFWSLFS